MGGNTERLNVIPVLEDQSEKELTERGERSCKGNPRIARWARMLSTTAPSTFRASFHESGHHHGDGISDIRRRFHNFDVGDSKCFRPEEWAQGLKRFWLPTGCLGDADAVRVSRAVPGAREAPSRHRVGIR
jgi:hypothetical protein